MKKIMFWMMFLLCSMMTFAADMYWTGQCVAVAQVDTFTPGGTIEVGDIFIITVTGWDGTSTTITFAATDTTVANVTDGLTDAWNDSTHALCTPMTAADNTTNLTLTADTAGDAFTAAASTTEAGGGAADAQTFSRAATTASAGPKHWECLDNWSGDGDLPGADAGDVVYIEDWSGDILYDLDQSGIANILTSLNIEKTFTGKIGVNGAAGFTGTYLDIIATAIDIGYNYSGATASGSGRIMIDTGVEPSTITVDATASGADTGKPACRFLADDVATDIIVNQGSVGIAYEVGETSTIDDLTIGYTTTAAAQTDVTIGSGLTVDAISKRIGTLTTRSGCTTLTNESGATFLYGSGTITTLTINSGTVYSSTSGTITTVNADGGTIDLTGSLTTRTITNCNIGNGGSLKFDPSIVTITNGITQVESSGKFLITSQEY